MTPNEVLQAAATTMIAGKVVTAVLVLAEVIDEDGDPAIVIMRDEGDAPWRHLGMLEVARYRYKATLDGALFGDGT
jgi:hypothetical protein